MSIKQIDEISRQISGAMRILHKSPRKAVKKGVFGKRRFFRYNK